LVRFYNAPYLRQVQLQHLLVPLIPFWEELLVPMLVLLVLLLRNRRVRKAGCCIACMGGHRSCCAAVCAFCVAGSKRKYPTTKVHPAGLWGTEGGREGGREGGKEGRRERGKMGEGMVGRQFYNKNRGMVGRIKRWRRRWRERRRDGGMEGEIERWRNGVLVWHRTDAEHNSVT